MKQAPEPGPFVRHFAEVATPILAERFDENRCLNATRICLEVMRHFKVRARAMSVRTEAFNEVFVRKMQELRRPPTDAEWPAWLADGAWSLGVDINAQPGDRDRNVFAGHVVAVVQDWLVDAAAVQLARPAKGIVVPDIFVGWTTPKFLKGEEWALYSNSDGAMLRYHVRPDDTSHYETAGFKPSQHNLDAAVAIYAGMKARMSSKERRTCP